VTVAQPDIWNGPAHSVVHYVTGEFLTTVGSGLQLCTLLLPPNMFLLFAASGNAAKVNWPKRDGKHVFKLTDRTTQCVSWALWGATHMCFIRYFALTNNVGDLTAKSEAQGAAAQIAGWISGISLISYSHTAAFLFMAYTALAPLHAVSTWQLLKSAQFEVLNESKALLIIKEFLATGSIPSMRMLRPQERLFGEFIDKQSQLPKIELGVTIADAFLQLDECMTAISVLRNENYLLSWNGSKFAVVFHRNMDGKRGIEKWTHEPFVDASM
jgi:hypothetical protein